MTDWFTRPVLHVADVVRRRLRLFALLVFRGLVLPVETFIAHLRCSHRGGAEVWVWLIAICWYAGEREGAEVGNLHPEKIQFTVKHSHVACSEQVIRLGAFGVQPPDVARLLICHSEPFGRGICFLVFFFCGFDLCDTGTPAGVFCFSLNF
jgi:hypothetical protein